MKGRNNMIAKIILVIAALIILVMFMAIVIAGKNADEQERKCFERYLKEKNRRAEQGKDS